MLLTKQQIDALRQIIQDASTALAITTLGYELPAEEVQRLVDEGWIRPQDVENLVGNAYRAGVATAEDPKSAESSLAELQRRLRVNPVQLSDVEQRAMKLAQDRAGQYCVGLGNRWSDKLGGIVIDADQVLAARTRRTIRDETAQAVARRETRGELATRLMQLTEDWSRDWDRIAATELQTAHQEGFFEGTLERHGEDALMARVPDPGACKTCLRLYTEDGKPMVRPMSWWMKQGNSNAGKKQSDWKPVYGPIHPWCRCVSTRVPKGWEVQADGSIEPIEKSLEKARKAEVGEVRQSGVRTTADRAAEEPISKADNEKVTSPLEGWQETKKPKLKWRNLTIRLENEEGDIRGWFDPNEAKSGFTLMDIPYGYIEGTKGTDGEELDCYVGRYPDAPDVFIVHQMKAPDFKTPDEDKAMIGFRSRAAAVKAYLAHYDNPRFLGSVTVMAADVFVKRCKRTNGEMIKAGVPGFSFHGPSWDGPVFSGGSKVQDPKSAAGHVIDATRLMEAFEAAAQGKRPKIKIDLKRFDFGFEMLSPPKTRPKQFADHLLRQTDKEEKAEENRQRLDDRIEQLDDNQQSLRDLRRWTQVKR